MTTKEINEYYEGLEHNCLNNYGGYTQKQVEENTKHLMNDSDDDDNDFPFAEIDAEEILRVMNREASGGPEDLF